MDPGILQSIQSRRDILYRHYDLPDSERQKAEALFIRMEQFGEKCRNQDEFERKLFTVTMNNEYNNLFVEFTAYAKEEENVSAGDDNAPARIGNTSTGADNILAETDTPPRKSTQPRHTPSCGLQRLFHKSDYK